ncbi:methyltransferase, partial [Oryctes borbonicus]
MHPRNIYNKRLDFKALADEFPEFRKHTVLDIKGRIAFDFKDLEALRTLSKTLLKKDFNLDLHFPQNGLIPTIPLRLNYILFIEDLLKSINRIEAIKGLDIGTGASCIYPLISARKNKWYMIGTDINYNAIEYAQRNVAKNALSHLIEVVLVKEETVLEEILRRDDARYDFCMCNPPFFGNPNELCSQLKRKLNRPLPKNAFVAEMHEVLTEGGEFAFVSKMIDESNKFHDRIRLYTSMIGIKRNIKPLLEKLQKMPCIKST